MGDTSKTCSTTKRAVGFGCHGHASQLGKDGLGRQMQIARLLHNTAPPTVRNRVLVLPYSSSAVAEQEALAALAPCWAIRPMILISIAGRHEPNETGRCRVQQGRELLCNRRPALMLPQPGRLPYWFLYASPDSSPSSRHPRRFAPPGLSAGCAVPRGGGCGVWWRPRPMHLSCAASISHTFMCARCGP